MTDVNANTKIHSADNLIAQEERAKLGIKETNNISPREVEALTKPDPSEEKPLYQNQETEASPEELSEKTEALQEDSPSQEDPSSKDKEADKSKDKDNDTDEYGNKVSKERLYTSEEVNKMIRDRLKNRQRDEVQPLVQQPVQQAQPETQEVDAENWEHQLESFIDKTIEKRVTRQKEDEYRRNEEEYRAQFEDKFMQGMNKYGDFQDVVSGKPVTDSMMMATRSMQDPAAFIYAACKQAPQEIDRIAKIQDPVTQIAEIGRLEERMKKARVSTKAPAPTDKLTSDVTTSTPKVNIDNLIQQYGKQKIRRR